MIRDVLNKILGKLEDRTGYLEDMIYIGAQLGKEIDDTLYEEWLLNEQALAQGYNILTRMKYRNN